MADWVSLLPELIQAIANCVLVTPTGGVSSYIDMRAVCPSWRSSIAKPSPVVAVADLRFRPRHWVMVHQKYDHNDDIDEDRPHLFFHVLSGRFRHLHLPMLRNQNILGASDGLLVLLADWDSFSASVLNPLTGDMLHYFPKMLHDYFECSGLPSVSGVSHSTLALLWGNGETIEFAGPTSDVFVEDIDTGLTSMVAFQGNVYYADQYGRVFKVVGPPKQFHCEHVAQVLPDVDACLGGKDGGRSRLVESDGELLLVCYGRTALKVFKIDVERRFLEEVKSLGRSRALFVGNYRCLSVDAHSLIPSVDGDCIYLSNMLERSSACMYNLRDDTIGIISQDYYLDRPFSLVQVLLKYCDATYM